MSLILKTCISTCRVDIWLIVKMMLGMPHCSARVLFPLQFLINANTGRQQMIVQVIQSLPPMWDTHIEFWAPCFGVAGP